MTTPTDIAALEADLAEIEARRAIVNDHAAEAAAKLAQARDAHAAHISAIVAGKASPAAAASSVPNAERQASLAQEAVQAVESEHGAATAALHKAKHDAEIAARESDLAAAADLAAEVDALAARLNEKYQQWLEANAAIAAKYDALALTSGQWEPYATHPGALLTSVLHLDVETANRLNIIAPRGKTLAERASK